MDVQLFVRNSFVTLFLYTIFLFVLYRRNGKKTLQIWNLFGSVTFCILMCAITTITGLTPLSGFHTDLRLNEVNWDAWKGFMDMANAGTFGFVNLAGNVILFMPVGFFFHFYAAKQGIL